MKHLKAKQLLLFTVSAVLCVAPVFAQTAPQAPETGLEAIKPKWREFCPKRYCDVSWDEPGRFYTLKEQINNHWYNRRNLFYKELETCKYAQDVATCYNQLRQHEAEKTATLNAEINQIRAQQRQAIQQGIQQNLQQMQQNRPRNINCMGDGAGGMYCTEY